MHLSESKEYKNYENNDTIRLSTGPLKQTRKPTRRLLIFFVTGNPGLSSFYIPYLLKIQSLLQTSITEADGQTSKSAEEKISIDIVSHSLAGFEISTSGHRSPLDEELYASTPARPLTLEQEVEFIERALRLEGSRLDERDGSGDQLQVVLVGHSVGAFILLELLRRRRARRKEEVRLGGQGVLEPKIVGGILLFPTVVDLARSLNGVKAALLLRVPGLLTVFEYLAKALVFLIPYAALLWIVMWVTDMPTTAARPAARFIKSRDGITQSLALLKDEMRTITTDKWDDDIWGATHKSAESEEKTKLFFYFGKKDHWVANETRDQIIAARARTGSGSAGDDDRPVMEVDQLDIPHAFPLRHSRPMASKTVQYVQEIIRGNWS